MIYYIKSMSKIDPTKVFDKKGGEWEMEKLDSVLKTIDFFNDKKIKTKDLPDICKRLRYQFIPAGKNVFNFGKFSSLSQAYHLSNNLITS